MASPVDYGKKAFDNFLLLCVQDNPDSPVAQEFKTELDQNISKGGLKAFQELNELLNKTKPETLEKFKNKSFQSAMLLMKSEMDKLGGKESLLPVFNPETEKELFLAEWNGKVQQVFKSISSKPGVNPASAAPSFLHEKEVKESDDSVTAREAMSSLIGILGGIVDGLEGQRSNELHNEHRKRPEVDEEKITPRYTTVINEIKKAFDKAQHCLSKVPITKDEIKTQLYLFREALTHILGNAFSVAELRGLKMPLLRGDRWLELKKGFIGERGPKKFKSPEALFNYFDNLQKRIIFVKQLEQFTHKNEYGLIKKLIRACLEGDELPDIALQAISKLPEQERLSFYYQLDPKDEKYEEKVKDLLNFCVQRKIKIEDLSLSLWPKLNAKEHNKLIKLLIYYGTDIEKIPKVAPDIKNLIDEAAKVRQVIYQKLVAKEIDPLIISRYTFPSREDLTPEQIIEGANLCLARDVRQL